MTEKRPNDTTAPTQLSCGRLGWLGHRCSQKLRQVGDGCRSIEINLRSVNCDGQVLENLGQSGPQTVVLRHGRLGTFEHRQQLSDAVGSLKALAHDRKMRYHAAVPGHSIEDRFDGGENQVWIQLTLPAASGKPWNRHVSCRLAGRDTPLRGNAFKIAFPSAKIVIRANRNPLTILDVH